MMEPIVDYAMYVCFAMDSIYDGAHFTLCYSFIFQFNSTQYPTVSKLMPYGGGDNPTIKRILPHHTNVNMDGIYDGAHYRL